MKSILRSNANFTFATWEEHLLHGVFSVDFASGDNGPRDDPSSTGALVAIPASPNGDHVYRPVALKGDWLKVTWDSGRSVLTEGWVRWRKNGFLILDLYYFA